MTSTLSTIHRSHSLTTQRAMGTRTDSSHNMDSGNEPQLGLENLQLRSYQYEMLQKTMRGNAILAVRGNLIPTSDWRLTYIRWIPVPAKPSCIHLGQNQRPARSNPDAELFHVSIQNLKVALRRRHERSLCFAIELYGSSDPSHLVCVVPGTDRGLSRSTASSSFATSSCLSDKALDR